MIELPDQIKKMKFDKNMVSSSELRVTSNKKTVLFIMGS